MTDLICVMPLAERSTTTARRKEKPKSLRGGGCLWITNSRGSGNSIGTISGNCNSIPCSSNEAEDRHLEKPCDSPTGDKLKGGVAKLEFVVSVNESADGLALVTTCGTMIVVKRIVINRYWMNYLKQFRIEVLLIVLLVVVSVDTP